MQEATCTPRTFVQRILDVPTRWVPACDVGGVSVCVLAHVSICDLFNQLSNGRSFSTLLISIYRALSLLL